MVVVAAVVVVMVVVAAVVVVMVVFNQTNTSISGRKRSSRNSRNKNQKLILVYLISIYLSIYIPTYLSIFPYILAMVHEDNIQGNISRFSST